MRICYFVPGALARHDAGEIERRAAFLAGRSQSGAQVVLVDDPDGPPCVESEAQEQRAASCVRRAVPRLQEHDAIIIGCFGDPGLEAACGLGGVPVIGPAGASLSAAARLADRIGILTVVEGVVPLLRRLVARCGLSDRVVAIRAVQVPVLELRARRDQVLHSLEAEAGSARSAGAEALVLGCMTMGFLDLPAQLQAAAGLQVVNPVIAALHAAESAAAAACPGATGRRNQAPGRRKEAPV